MRLWVSLVLLTVPFCAWSQQRGAYAGPGSMRLGGIGATAGGGGIYGGQTGQRGMYGGISTGQIVGSVNDPGFAGRLGATVSSLPQTTTRIPVQPVYRGNWGGGGGWNRGGGRVQTLVVPYGVPVMYGGGIEAYTDQQAVQTIVQPVQPPPSVIINQYYTPETAKPEMKEYSNLPEPIGPPRTEVERGSVRVTPPSALADRPVAPQQQSTEEAFQAANRATITTLVFQDGSQASAIAYWLQGDQLHYVASDYSKVAVPVASFDKPRTEQVNRDKGLEFRLESVR